MKGKKSTQKIADCSKALSKAIESLRFCTELIEKSNLMVNQSGAKKVVIALEAISECEEALISVSENRIQILNDTLLEALYTALPYVEDAEESPDFKKGCVSAHVKKIRSAIDEAEVI